MADKVIDDILYIFVNLNDHSSPDYYIATAKEARSRVKEYGNRGVINLSAFKSKAFIDRWDKVKLVEKRLKKTS